MWKFWGMPGSGINQPKKIAPMERHLKRLDDVLHIPTNLSTCSHSN